MILQIDSRLQVDPRWEKNGCALMTVFYFVNKFTNFPFDIETILTLGDQFVRHQYVNEEFFVNDWEGAFNFFPKMKVIYTDRHETPDRACRGREFEILKWYNPRTRLGHFTGGNGYGYVTYDPMGESITVEEGFLQSKRIFRRI
jgi:hypothetical protein